MITYEINVICDACEDEIFGAMPDNRPDVPAALTEAEGDGWETRQHNGIEIHRCPQCVANGLFPKTASQAV